MFLFFQLKWTLQWWQLKLKIFIACKKINSFLSARTKKLYNGITAPCNRRPSCRIRSMINVFPSSRTVFHTLPYLLWLRLSVHGNEQKSIATLNCPFTHQVDTGLSTLQNIGEMAQGGHFSIERMSQLDHVRFSHHQTAKSLCDCPLTIPAKKE